MNFIFLGRVEKIKGIRILLNAWKQVDADRHLYIYGEGPESLWVREFVATHELRNVHPMGRVDHDLVTNKLVNSDAMIMPTQCFEGFPMTIVESLSCGTPVIGSDIGNVKGIIEETHAGQLFRYNDESSLSMAVNQFNPTLFDSDQIRLVFSHLYSPESNYACYKKILDCISQ